MTTRETLIAHAVALSEERGGAPARWGGGRAHLKELVRVLRHLSALHPSCGECPRAATVFLPRRRDVFCAIHGARSPLERRRALTDERRRRNGR